MKGLFVSTLMLTGTLAIPVSIPNVSLSTGVWAKLDADTSQVARSDTEEMGVNVKFNSVPLYGIKTRDAAAKADSEMGVNVKFNSVPLYGIKQKREE